MHKKRIGRGDPAVTEKGVAAHHSLQTPPSEGATRRQRDSEPAPVAFMHVLGQPTTKMMTTMNYRYEEGLGTKKRGVLSVEDLEKAHPPNRTGSGLGYSQTARPIPKPIGKQGGPRFVSTPGTPVLQGADNNERQGPSNPPPNPQGKVADNKEEREETRQERRRQEDPEELEEEHWTRLKQQHARCHDPVPSPAQH